MKYSFKLKPFVIGVGLLSIPTFSLLISSLFFVGGLSINSFIFPISIVLSLLLIYFLAKKNIKEFLISTLYFSLIIAFSLFISAFFYDYSWDGQCYHQDIILQLKNGWNPIYDHHAPYAHPNIAVWVNHYAKGLETIAATIYSTTGEIETGKAVNFILVFASIFLFYNFLKICFDNLSKAKKVLLSILFALCPVVANQILTFYIDWAAYSLLLILIPSLICFIKRENKYYLFIISSVIFLSATIKFNLLFWVVFTIFFYLLYIVVVKNYQLLKKIIITCSVSGIFAILLAGFNPYITNTIDHKNIFYPLVGEDKIDIMEINTPYNLKNTSNAKAVVISLFALPHNPMPEYPLEYAKPSNLRKDVILGGTGSVDFRVGGFGFFFSWILTLSSLLYLAVIFYQKDFKNRKRLNFDIFLFILLISLFLLPYGWWARYFPFFYAFPLVILLYLELNSANNIFIVICKNVIYLLLIINIIGITYGSVRYALKYKENVDKTISCLSQSENIPLINLGYNVSFRIKLEKQKIQYQETKEDLTTVLFLGPHISFDSTKYAIENDYLIEKHDQ